MTYPHMQTILSAIAHLDFDRGDPRARLWGGARPAVIRSTQLAGAPAPLGRQSAPAAGFSAPTGGTTIVVDKLAGGGSGTKADRCRALHTDGNTLIKWAQADEAAGDHSSPL